MEYLKAKSKPVETPNVDNNLTVQEAENNEELSNVQEVALEKENQNIGPEESTADVIARELAESQMSIPPIELVNYAPQHLLPGQCLKSKSRKAGPSLQKYRSMAKEIL